MFASFGNGHAENPRKYTLGPQSLALIFAVALIVGGYPVCAQRGPEFQLESQRVAALPDSVSPNEPTDIRSSTPQRPPRSAPLNDLCGSSNNMAISSAPTANLCNTGTISAVSGGGRWRWSCIDDDGTMAQCSAPVKTATLVQKPGPSADLFANPYYTCVHNYYVSSSGSDSNNGSSNSPWRTLQRAETVPRAAGDCINVAPGVYSGMNVGQGGNAAVTSGYVVYRCMVMDACTIADPGRHHNAAFYVNANYIILDGFALTVSQQQTFGQGVEVWPGTNNYVFSQHHVWVLNSIISGYGQSGAQMNNGEFFYVVHNTFYNNGGGANCDSGAQGSGISLTTPIPIPRYSLTSDDQNNPVTGNTGTLFRNFIMWNVVYNNRLSCSPGNATDGNGIIVDTWSWGCGAGGSGCQTGASAYTNGGLVAFNVIYNNGGAGVHDQNSQYVTIANNSCYNNYLDTNNSATARSCIDTLFSYGNTVINNIAYAVCGSGNLAYNTAYGPDGPGNSGALTTRLNEAIDSSAMSLTITSAAKMLTGSSGYAGNGSYALPGGNVIEIDRELMQVKAGWGTTTLTITRGVQGTTPAPHANGATVTWVPDYFANNVGYTTGKCPIVNGPFNGNVYPASLNTSGNPGWVNVGNTSAGSQSTQPVGTNFALQPRSPAIGRGVAEPYLPAQSVDVGACSSTLAMCP